jgi:hypothetical protein
MRDYTETFIASLSQETTNVVVLDIFDITHPSLDEPIRVVNNVEDISVNGDVYTAIGFEFSEPEETEEGLRQATIKLNNVDQVFTDLIRSLRGDLFINAKCVTATNLATSPKQFNNIEYDLVPLEILNATYDNFNLILELSYELVSHRKYPKDTYNPFDFPGMF